MSKIQRPVLYYLCVHCGATELSPTLPKGWKEVIYLDTTDNYGSTWHLGYNCAACIEKQPKESDNEDNQTR